MTRTEPPSGADAEPREGSGLVNSPLASPMLQPWEVWDQELFDTEMLRVFGRSWVWLGDTEDLRSPGDYITGKIGYQPVLVIRQPDGSIKGFLNNCRHRASGLLFEPSGNCGATLTCPYHNWSYNIDGRLLRVPDLGRMYPDGLPLEDYGLVPFRIEVAWGKLVFGCLSQRTEPFREWIAPLAGRYDRYGFENFSRYHRQLDETYDINWKAFVENSNDDYHVRFVHRRMNRYRKQMDTIVRFSGRTCSGYKPHAEIDDAAGGRDDLSEEQLLGHYADFIYPNLTPLPYPTQLILVRADPIAPNRTRLLSADLRHRQDARRPGARTRDAGGDQHRGHLHGDPAHGEPAVTVLPGRAAERLGGARRAPHEADPGGRRRAAGPRRVRLSPVDSVPAVSDAEGSGR